MSFRDCLRVIGELFCTKETEIIEVLRNLGSFLPFGQNIHLSADHDYCFGTHSLGTSE